MMAQDLIEPIPRVLSAQIWPVFLDLTGGASNSTRSFGGLSLLREFWVTVIDRCNLTILSEPGGLARFLADEGVHTGIAALL